MPIVILIDSLRKHFKKSPTKKRSKGLFTQKPKKINLYNSIICQTKKKEKFLGKLSKKANKTVK